MRSSNESDNQEPDDTQRQALRWGRALILYRTAPTWQAALDTLEREADLLLTEATSELMESIIADLRADGDLTEADSWQVRLEVLNAARMQGVLVVRSLLLRRTSLKSRDCSSTRLRHRSRRRRNSKQQN